MLFRRGWEKRNAPRIRVTSTNWRIERARPYRHPEVFPRSTSSVGLIVFSSSPATQKLLWLRLGPSYLSVDLPVAFVIQMTFLFVFFFPFALPSDSNMSAFATSRIIMRPSRRAVGFRLAVVVVVRSHKIRREIQTLWG